MYRWKTFLIFGVFLVAGFLLLNLIPRETTSPALSGLLVIFSRASQKTIELLTEASDEILPMFFATLFGGLGALLLSFYRFAE